MAFIFLTCNSTFVLGRANYTLEFILSFITIIVLDYIWNDFPDSVFLLLYSLGLFEPGRILL